MSVETPPLFEQDEVYSAEALRHAFGTLLQRGSAIGSIVGGLVTSTDMQVTAGSGMQVLVAPGEAWIAGTSVSTQGGYLGRVTSSTALAIAASSETNPRIDTIIAQVKDKAVAGGEDIFTVAVVMGTPEAGATLVNKKGAGAVPASSLVLAYVLVPAKASSIVAGDIENVAQPLVPGLQSATYREGTAAERPAAGVKGRIYYATDTKIYSVDTGAAWNELTAYTASAILSAKSIIATEQSRENTAYGTMPTPDEVTITLPENGLIAMAYQATLIASGGNIGAAIFLNGNELKGVLGKEEVEPKTTGGSPAFYTPGAAGTWLLASSPSGVLVATTKSAYLGDATTGQTVGFDNTPWGQGPCYIFAAAGTYKINVQYKNSTGKVSVKNRKLWAWVVA